MLAAEKAETSRDISSHLFLVVAADLLALLPFPWFSRTTHLSPSIRERLPELPTAAKRCQVALWPCGGLPPAGNLRARE
jgi:hypothetical protein